MHISPLKIVFLSFLSMFLLHVKTHAQVLIPDEHIEVSLRMIGHQILLQAGDSTSRVLPIREEQGKYKISFDTEFAFNPDTLVHTVNTLVKDTGIGMGYNLQVATCETGEVVYSYEISDLEGKNIIPCASRDVPMGCYDLLIILKNATPTEAEHAEVAMNEVKDEDDQRKYIPFALGLMIFIGVLLMLRKRRKAVNEDPHVISLGRFLFDTRTAALTLDGDLIELSGKEAELLQVLCEKANETIARDVILNLVWGDEGDYVGRTLDVFISKLRKKLEKDPKVKIVNIRGVGYKLLMDD
jgi:hypothetical protein